MTGPEVSTWSETLGLLSEGPLWHEECQELLWVDILGGQLHRGRLAADGGLDRVRTIADRSARRGGRTRRGRRIRARCGRGVSVADEAGSVRELAQPEAGRTQARTNDGACDPQAGSGQWYGTPTPASTACCA
ncbi:MAG TPA: SMP-30/gluconolactonase/LRE family protein [Jiangellaceae bacterium]|nr:SMP-30/gluconolactonase/LRE family protein [Jiangellaceae bacterium]